MQPPPGAVPRPVGAPKRKVVRAIKKKVPGAPPTDSKGKADSSDYDSGSDGSDSDNEGTEDYKKGGYHPVFVGEKYKNGRYTVLRKLGWGHFSTVWLVLDNETQQYGAMKVQKSAKHYTEAAYDEITLLAQIRDGDADDSKHCVRLLDHFDHTGPHGKHVCMVFEVLGENLLALIKRFDYRGIPIDVVRNLTKQMLIGLDYLHRERDIIHTDFKPENVMLCQPLRDRTWEIPDVETLARQPAAAASAAAPAAAPSQPQAQPRANGTSAPADSGGLSKSQKKKAKKKAKKQAAKTAAGGEPGEGEAGDEEDDDTGLTGEDSELSRSQSQSVSVPRPEAANQDAGDVTSQQRPQSAGGNGVPDAAENGSAGPASTGGAGEGAYPSSSGRQVITTPGLTDEELLTAKCKLVDFGNACWTYKQFTTDVQTRQYRSPEVILGAKYSTPCDLWSLACMVFELVTGDLLFDPRSGNGYDRDEDHLAQFMELLGRVPRKVYEKGKYAREYFNRNGELRHIKRLKFWPLDRVLVDKYHLPQDEAEALAAFMVPMLEFVPEKRATAKDMLSHPWLSGDLQAAASLGKSAGRAAGSARRSRSRSKSPTPAGQGGSAGADGSGGKGAQHHKKSRSPSPSPLGHDSVPGAQAATPA